MHPLLRLPCAWILVGLYAGDIFVVSFLSHPPSVSPWGLPHLDKLYHTLADGSPTFVLIRALCLTGAARPITSIVFWAGVLATFYGALDEFHQAFTPNRTMGMCGFLADAIGASMVSSVRLSLPHRWSMLVKS